MPDADMEVLLPFIPTLPEKECQGPAATSAIGRRCDPSMSMASLPLLLGSSSPPSTSFDPLLVDVSLS
jgi:hypothetical protein